MKNIKKNILILGASSDIGANLVKTFVKENYFVFAHYNSQKKKLLELPKHKVKLIKSNFTKFNDLKLKNFLKHFKKKDISYIINLIGDIDNISYINSNLKNQISNLKSNTLVPNLIIKNLTFSMIKNKFGRILNCSSIGVKFGGGINTYNYSFAKHSLEFIPSELKKLSKKNILINNLRIGVTNTKIHKKISNKNLSKRVKLIPIGRIAEINEITNYITFLISDKNTYLTGETITVSGGE